MRILLSGSHGLIGSAFLRVAGEEGDEIVRLVRPGSPEGGVEWDIAAGRLDPADLPGFDAVVHLAGESILGRWTAAKRNRIRDSRVDGTRLLCEALVHSGKPPPVLACASAIGFYGSGGGEPFDETAAAGEGFLAEVCREWEAAAEPARREGIRVVHLRFGVVLTPAGGALGRMLLPFRLGLGGRLGSGRQYMSWISLDDAVGALRHALATASLSGPVNVVGPAPATNLEFTRTLGRVLRRPTLLPVPGFAARLLFGRMADEILLAGPRVQPAQLVASGYRFQHAELEAALRHLLGRP